MHVELCKDPRIHSLSSLQNIASPPLSFVRSGHVALDTSSLRLFGSNNYNWSSSAVEFEQVTSATAHHLDVNASYVYPSRGPNNRWFGFPIRCLIRRATDQ